jgi:hypothetical protein
MPRQIDCQIHLCGRTGRLGRRAVETLDPKRSEEAGSDAHLVKPVDEIALRKLLLDLGARKQEVKT